MHPTDVLQMNWVLYRRGPKAQRSTFVWGHHPGAQALRNFYQACDEGKPGTYELRGSAARKVLVLASATVGDHDMAITWSVPAIFFSLGAKGMHDEAVQVEGFLKEQGAMVA